MNIGKRKLSGSTAILLSVLVVSAVLGATILYTLTIPMQFRVSLALGLELWDATKTAKVTTITWNDFARGETQNQTFYIKNVGNKNANVTLSLGSYDTGAWLITNTFANQTVLKGGFSTAFTVTIEEINAISDGYYACNLVFDIVDHFNVAYEEPPRVWFEASSIAYSGNTSLYLQFVSESFDHANPYNASESVAWQFTTKNPSDTYILQSYSYQIDLFNASGISGTVFNGMSGSMLGLLKDQTNTITHVFNAPSQNGSYYLKLTYTGHNSEYIPPLPTPISWFVTTDLPGGPLPIKFLAGSVTVTGATKTGEVGTISFTVVTGNAGGSAYYNYSVCVFSGSDLILTIASGSDYHDIGAINYHFDFTMATGGNLIMLVSLFNIH